MKMEMEMEMASCVHTVGYRKVGGLMDGWIDGLISRF